jgi:hypothetical protein
MMTALLLVLIVTGMSGVFEVQTLILPEVILKGEIVAWTANHALGLELALEHNMWIASLPLEIPTKRTS